MASYRYKAIPIVPVAALGEIAVVEQNFVSSEKYAVGDLLPIEPGTWRVERVGLGGITHWQSESSDRHAPETTTALTLYCRVED